MSRRDRDEEYVALLESLGCIDPEVSRPVLDLPVMDLPKRRGGRRGHIGLGRAGVFESAALPIEPKEKEDRKVFERTVKRVRESEFKPMTTCMTPDWTPAADLYPVDGAAGRDIEVDGGGTWEIPNG